MRKSRKELLAGRVLTLALAAVLTVGLCGCRSTADSGSAAHSGSTTQGENTETADKGNTVSGGSGENASGGTSDDEHQAAADAGEHGGNGNSGKTENSDRHFYKTVIFRGWAGDLYVPANNPAIGFTGIVGEDYTAALVLTYDTATGDIQSSKFVVYYEVPKGKDSAEKEEQLINFPGTSPQMPQGHLPPAKNAGAGYSP